MAKNSIPYFTFYPAAFMGGVRSMTPQEIGVYTMLLCRMYEENGPVEYHILRLSTYCGMREKAFVGVAEKLMALGKITMREGMIFNDRAAIEISDRSDKLKNNSKAGKASAEKRQQNQGAQPTDVEHMFNHKDRDRDIDQKEEAKASHVLSDAVEIYNATADETGWPKVQKLSPARSQALKARLRDCGGIDGWRIAMDKGKASAFLTGQTSKPFTGCGFDWITKQANFTKLMEGNYDNRNSDTARLSNPNTTALEIAFAARARRTPGVDCF